MKEEKEPNAENEGPNEKMFNFSFDLLREIVYAWRKTHLDEFTIKQEVSCWAIFVRTARQRGYFRKYDNKRLKTEFNNMMRSFQPEIIEAPYSKKKILKQSRIALSKRRREEKKKLEEETTQDNEQEETNPKESNNLIEEQIDPEDSEPIPETQNQETKKDHNKEIKSQLSDEQEELEEIKESTIYLKNKLDENGSEFIEEANDLIYLGNEMGEYCKELIKLIDKSHLTFLSTIDFEIQNKDALLESSRNLWESLLGKTKNTIKIIGALHQQNQMPYLHRKFKDYLDYYYIYIEHVQNLVENVDDIEDKEETIL